MAYRLLVLILILGVNAFFAAAEVALVSVRKSRLRAMAAEGQLGAQAALNLLANPARLLSVTQLGVTLASLGLGWAGEGTLFSIVMFLGRGLITPATEPYVHGAGFTLAFLLMSYAHVVIGEVVPKNLAIEKADRLALLVAPALLLFYRVSSPFVFVVEQSAAAASRLIGLQARHGGGGHSAEELKLIIGASGTDLHPFERAAIQSLLELSDYYVREIMVPRHAVNSVSVEASLDEVLLAMSEHKFSRLPVYEGDEERIIGYVHYKDLLPIVEERLSASSRRQPPRPFRIRRVLRRLPVVPETKPVPDLIDEFRNTHRHMAMVVDEFGTIVGLVTLEDVLEQIFGEIGDEHDAKRPQPKAEIPVIDVDGSTTIRDLDTHYGVELPGDAGFETLAGFLLYRLGYIPKENESVEFDGRRFTVLEMHRNRIARVRIEKLPPPTEMEPAKTGSES